MTISDKLISLDPIIIFIYLIVSLLLGVWGSRLLGMKNTREDDYFLAGRKMPGWLNGMSVAATALNTDVAPVYCGVAVVTGLSGCWFFLSRFGLGLLVGAIIFAVRWRQMGIKTGPEFFHLRFSGGRQTARIYASVTSVLFGMTPWIGAGLIGIHLVAAPIFGIESRLVTLLVVLPLLTVYVWSSGLAGVLLTDALQGFIILGANVVMIIAVLAAFGGPAALADAVTAALPEQAEQILSVLPGRSNSVLPPSMVVAWLLITTFGAGSSVGSEGQRVFSCRSDREGAKVGVWGEIVLFLMLLMLPALGVLARHPEFYEASPAEREQAYGVMLLEFLPPGCVGLTVAALLAAVMSTISTHLNYGSQTLLNDVYRPIFGDPDPKKAVWIGRLLMLAIVGLSVIVVYCSGSLIGIAITVLGVFGTSALFGWAQWWCWRVNFKSWCAAVLGGPPVYLLCWYLLPNLDWWQIQISRGEAQAQNMQLLQTLIAIVINMAIWVAAMLLTKPEPMETLKEFYLRARPMGMWGPVRRALIAEGKLEDRPAPRLLLPGFGVVLIGFAMIACGVMTLAKLYIGDWPVAGSLAGGSLVAGIGFKYAFNHYIGRLTGS